MNNGSVIFAFSLGAAIGSVVTWKILKTKYEKIARDEIESMRAYFKKKHGPIDATDENDFGADTKNKYSDIIESANYDTAFDDVEKGGIESVVNTTPYVIPPEEFGEKDDYDTFSYTYYADGILTDERDEIVEDVDDTVGLESLEHFGDYEDDSVFVRNDRLKADFEILRDLSTRFALVDDPQLED